MKHLSILLKPASSLCNMRCQYCFYEDISQQRQVASHGIMQNETTHKLIENVFAELQNGDNLTFAFQGGEPALAGLAYFEDFIACVQAQPKQVKLHYTIQTNGTLLDEAWCRFLKNHNFLVGLSIDGGSVFHNANRFDSTGKGNYHQVLAAKKQLDRWQVDYNILCVLTREMARHPKKVWKFIEDESIQYIQFIPCLASLSGEDSPWAVTPKRFASFYTQLFQLWSAAVHNNQYISIKLFDDIANQFIRKQLTACGIHGKCSPQNVIEADGSVYPCDFYVLDRYKQGNITHTPIAELNHNAYTSSFLESRPALPSTCMQCTYLAYCGGGCKRMEKAMYVDNSGFCGYQSFLNSCLDPLCRIALQLMK